MHNILLSIGAKGVSIVSSLLLVSVTIDYVNPTRYGIWLTLSQIIGWIGFFDLGVGNGFRNRFAEAKANGNLRLVRQYVSTAYFAITAMMVIVLAILLVCNHYIDWTIVLGVSNSYKEELGQVFNILGCFFCLNMIVNLFSTLLTADQKPGQSAVIYSAGQLASLGVILLLTHVTDGSLLNLALYFSGIPVIVTLVASAYAFLFTRYRVIRPRFSEVRVGLIKDILGLGLRFFLIYLCMIAIFQVMNIVISREIGAASVTEYNVAYRYFNVLYSVMLIIITPFWSAFTDAYTKRDFTWMRTTVKNLEKTWALSIAAGVVMLAVSPFAYRIWIGDSVSISLTLSAWLLVFVMTQALSNIYMYIINGIGFIRIQFVTYLLFALISWPAMTYSCRTFGISGIVIVPTVTYLVQAVLSKIQVSKLLSNNAAGWWRK